jgi:peptidoglycan/LPS O-acetylase OafA/YrhL
MALTAFFITPCRLDGLLAGSWVALAWRDQEDWEQFKRFAGQLVLGAGCLLLGIALGQRHFIPDADTNLEPIAAVDGSLAVTLGIAALAVFFSGLIALAVDSAEGSRLRSLLESNGLRAIGKYSYAIYIFHSLILSATVQLVTPLSHAPAFVAKPIAVIWVLAISFVAAWSSYHPYEKHFLRLKRYFEYQEPAHSQTLDSSRVVSFSNA